MPRPTDAGAFAERMYTALDPYAVDDPNQNWALLIFLGGGGQMFQEVEDIASDGPDGEPGYGNLMDPDAIPAKGLPWLGQFVGASVDANLSEANQRQQLKDVNAQKRGSLSAIQNAPKPYLTGAQRVIVIERDANVCPSDPSAGLSVYTIASETTNSAAVLAALLRVKPAGIIMTYAALSSQTWSILEANYATWNAVIAHYPDWNSVVSDTSGI